MYRRIALVAVLGVAAAGLTAAPASAAKAACKNSYCEYEIQTLFWEKTESKDTKYASAKFITRRAGKVQVDLTYKHRNHAVGVRLVTCGKKSALTGWRQLNAYNHYFKFDKSVKKGTCFRVQAGRSDAGTINGTLHLP
ncbi:hypothetical protein GCM10023196_044330 [Actinoallomurus vinaceus]|uniref:Secreted protein n=1 Tax=Actinoallomurus vinaceus TaxID=1080074 RepID=A0ABP8UBH0_9ACTN